MFYKAVAIGLCLGVLSAPSLAKKGHDQELPPGLQKKVERGEPLPPGWSKKLERGDRLDEDLYARGRVVVPLGKDGSITLEIDGRLIRLQEKTREILEILGAHH